MKSKINQVVLVDDNPDFHYLVQVALEDCEPACNLTILSSGTELIDWLEVNKRPNVICLDIHMPGTSGFDVLTLLRKTDRYKAIPVIIFSISDEEHHITKSYDLGANAYLAKPLSFP